VADGAKLYLGIAKMATRAAAVQPSVPQVQWTSNVDLQLRWYALYTCANHEKKAAKEIVRRGVESFLPVYKTTRRWSDRRVQVEVPLFAGYVFVHLALCDRLKILQVPGVVRLVGFGGLPTALPDEQMATLRAGLNGVHAQPHPFLAVGRRVKIKRGPLAGMQGILLRRKGCLRVVLSIDLIMRSVAVDADAADVEPI
jgi:transcription antitermination factor NusG